jgi:hypothetical protein
VFGILGEVDTSSPLLSTVFHSPQEWRGYRTQEKSNDLQIKTNYLNTMLSNVENITSLVW